MAMFLLSSGARIILEVSKRADTARFLDHLRLRQQEEQPEESGLLGGLAQPNRGPPGLWVSPWEGEMSTLFLLHNGGQALAKQLILLSGCSRSSLCPRHGILQFMCSDPWDKSDPDVLTGLITTQC